MSTRISSWVTEKISKAITIGRISLLADMHQVQHSSYLCPCSHRISWIHWKRENNWKILKSSNRNLWNGRMNIRLWTRSTECTQRYSHQGYYKLIILAMKPHSCTQKKRKRKLKSSTEKISLSYCTKIVFRSSHNQIRRLNSWIITVISLYLWSSYRIRWIMLLIGFNINMI